MRSVIPTAHYLPRSWLVIGSYQLLIIMVTFLLSLSANANESLFIAKVFSFSGDVKVLDNKNNSREIGEGTQLLIGDQLITGADGYAVLKVKDGSTFNVIPNSSIPINDSLSRDAPVGTVLFVHGKVEIVSTDDLYRQAIKGGKVYQGDVINTAAASSLQLDMIDNGYFAVRPNSKIKISEYLYQKKDTDKVSTSLLRGGLRSITGSIGQANKKNFELLTPVATIGIRGTDLVAFYLSEQDAALKTKKFEQETPSGSYLKVQSGEAELATEIGAQPVKPNEIAFTASNTAPPKPLAAEYADALFAEETYETLIPGRNAPLEEDSPIAFMGSVGVGLAQASRFYNINLVDDGITLATLPLIGRSFQWGNGVTDSPKELYGVARLSGELHYTPVNWSDLYVGAALSKRAKGSKYDITNERIKLGARFNLGKHVVLSTEFSHLFADSKNSWDTVESDSSITSEPGYKTKQFVSQLDFALSPAVNVFTRLHLSKIQWKEANINSVHLYRNKREVNFVEIGSRYQTASPVMLSASILNGEVVVPDGSSIGGLEGSGDIEGTLSGLKLRADIDISVFNLFAGLDFYRTKYDDIPDHDKDTIRMLTLGGSAQVSDQIEFDIATRHITEETGYSVKNNATIIEARISHQF